VNGRAGIWKQRIPFGGLSLAAALGILLARSLPIDSTYWVVAACTGFVWWGVRRRTLPLLAATAACFAAIQLWQGRESPAGLLASTLGDRVIHASATGTVALGPQPASSGRLRFPLRCESLRIEGRDVPVDGLMLHVSTFGAAIAQGDRIDVSGSLSRLPRPRNPGAFDVAAVMAPRGITCELVSRAADEVAILEGGSLLLKTAGRCRAWMERTLTAGIGDEGEVAALLKGMVLGITWDLPGTLREQFRLTGTYHLFSVSGLHVGMIALILWQVLGILGCGRRTTVAIVIPALFFYALLTGWKPASVRAATMSAIFLAGMLSSRGALPLNSLCAAAFAILAHNTNELLNPGFQLSFSVAGAIILLAGPLRDTFGRLVEPDPFLPARLRTPVERWCADQARKAATLPAVCIAAWAGSLPLGIVYFHFISLSALVVNLVAVPLAFLILSTAMLSLAAGLVATPLSIICNNANLALVKGLVAIVQTAAALPGSHLVVGDPLRSGADITVFDFGRGGGAAWEGSGGVWMLDAGSSWDAKTTLAGWLRDRGRVAPDAVVLTHGDAGHVGGALDLLRIEPRLRILESAMDDRSPSRKALHAAMEEAGIRSTPLAAGDTLDAGGGSVLRILHPRPEFAGRTSDDKGLVCLLEHRGLRVLFLADAGVATAWELEGLDDASLRADIVVLGGHRRHRGIEASLLQRISPAVVIAGAHPLHEPLTESWAAMVEGLGIRLMRLDHTGAVLIKADGNGFRATPWLGGGEVRVRR
jgi:competence protein ComEC